MSIIVFGYNFIRFDIILNIYRYLCIGNYDNTANRLSPGKWLGNIHHIIKTRKPNNLQIINIKIRK